MNARSTRQKESAKKSARKSARNPARKSARAAGHAGADAADAADAPTALADAKRALRTEIAASMRALGPLRRAWRSAAVCDFALRSPPLARCGVVLAYRAMDDEACVDELVGALAAQGWRVAFPRLDAQGAMRLFELETGAAHRELAPLFDQTRWTTDRYGIRAPLVGVAGARPLWPRELDAVLVPGRAFDRSGNRLGRGKGYYDRLLAALRPDARAATLGIAFSEQIRDAIPAGEGDRPVAWIASDRGLTRARR